MTFIYFLLALTVIICLHELGHLIAAKIFGVYCYEYSFGMGPVLFQKKGKETTYSIRAIPVGGFVSMAGETDGDEVYPDVTVPKGRRLTDQKPWKKIIIMLAGVLMNFILAWIIFSMITLSNGTYAVSPKAVIAEVGENSPAEKAGMQPGDKILKITAEDGSFTKPDTFLDMRMFVAEKEDKTLTYEIQRGEEVVKVSVTPEYNAEQESYMIGIVGNDAELVPVNLLNCWIYGFKMMLLVGSMMFSAIINLFKGIGLKDLSGPVGIYNATEEYVALGFSSYMLLIAQLSLNVGIFNLLPLPVLDGGQVIVTLVEWIIGKPLNQKVKTVIMTVCWVLLIGLMLFVTWNDIARLF